MVPTEVMRGFPPPADKQVTLENWRTPPFNRWAFQHLREILPTAAIKHAPDAISRLDVDLRDIPRIGFEAPGGAASTVADMLATTYTDGFIVLHRGRIVCEHYDNGMAPDSHHILMSVSKSVTASLAGILAGAGRLDVDAPVTDYLPEVAGSAYGGATVRHVLDMTVGVRFDEDYQDETGDFARYRMATGWLPCGDASAPATLRSFLPTLEKNGDHGVAFHYVSPNSDLLGWILERASGVSFSELLSREMWSPMGAEHEAYIGIDSQGAPRTAGGICTSLRDLARFGQMHLDDGRTNGDAIVPAGWIADMRAGGDRDTWRKGGVDFGYPIDRYRSKWYAAGDSHDALFGIGIFGQFVYVDWVANMVIAKFSSDPLAVNDANEAITMRAFKTIGAALAED